VGDLALMMVSQGLTAADVVDPDKEIAFPASVVEMLRGDLGQPEGGWPEALQRKVLKGEAAINVRPGALLPELDLARARAEGENACDRQLGDREFASYLMYPKVFTEFAHTVRRYGPVWVMPTPVFFYGMKPGEEITVEIERGKVLVIQLTAIGETHEDGRVELFFELNGQPRLVAVPNRAAAATAQQRRKAEDGNDAHVAAPMPGSIATLVVKPGQSVTAGDVLLTLEAMKMETALHAPRDATIAEVLVQPGSQVDAKDLLIVLG
jgi:pyruvate carboxylase